MFCYKCGKQIPDEAAFCPYCGTAPRGAASTPPTPQPQPMTAAAPPQKKGGKWLAIVAVAAVLVGGVYLAVSQGWIGGALTQKAERAPVLIASRSNDEYEYYVYDDHVDIMKYIGAASSASIPSELDG